MRRCTGVNCSHHTDHVINIVIFGVCCSEGEKFDMYGLGTQVYASHREKSVVEDRLHFFAEECDNLQVSSFVFYNVPFYATF